MLGVVGARPLRKREDAHKNGECREGWDLLRFGHQRGHEEMLKRFMVALVGNAQIDTLYILAPKQNTALYGFVEDLARAHPKVQTIGLPYTAESIRGNPFALLRVTRSTSSVLRRLKLTRLLVAQGTIVSGLAGLFAARLTRTRSVSYLPLVGDGPGSAA